MAADTEFWRCVISIILSTHIPFNTCIKGEVGLYDDRRFRLVSKIIEGRINGF